MIVIQVATLAPGSNNRKLSFVSSAAQWSDEQCCCEILLPKKFHQPAVSSQQGVNTQKSLKDNSSCFKLLLIAAVENWAGEFSCCWNGRNDRGPWWVNNWRDRPSKSGNDEQKDKFEFSCFWFKAPRDAPEVMLETESSFRDFTDNVTLDTYWRLNWYDHDTHDDDHDKMLLSVEKLSGHKS